jgi:hypothetical protein
MTKMKAKITLETSGKDVKLHSKRVEKITAVAPTLIAISRPEHSSSEFSFFKISDFFEFLTSMNINSKKDLRISCLDFVKTTLVLGGEDAAFKIFFLFLRHPPPEGVRKLPILTNSLTKKKIK